MTKTRKVVVVKKLSDLSPSKRIVVSRSIKDDDDISQLKPSLVGNVSPQKPERNSEGVVVPRSILGESEVFDRIDRKKKQLHRATVSSRNSIGSNSSYSINSASKDPTVSYVDDYNDDEDGSDNGIDENDDEILDGADGDDFDSRDLANKPDEYLRTLKKKLLKGEEIVAFETTVNKEKNPESKTLALWEERQREWDRIQLAISKKLKAGQNHSLMMATTDEYRAKIEEYDLLQSAIPIEEKFGANAWQRTLRGGGPRTVAIGHIFSGIECEVEDVKLPPKTVRKPLKNSGISGNTVKDIYKTTFIDETPIVLKKKRQLAKKLNELRPHVVTYSNAAELIIKSKNLYEWAYESSSSYFKECDKVKQLTKQNDDKRLVGNAAYKVHSDGSKLQDSKSALSTAIAIHDSILDVPQISVQSSGETLFRGNQGEVVSHIISFTNTGSIAVAFKWSVKPDQDKSREISKIIDSKYGEQTRELLFNKLRTPFHCQKEKGVILPGDTVNTMFSFLNKAAAGISNATWMLTTVPSCKFTCMGQAVADADNRAPFYLKLRGYSVSVDECISRRAKINAVIESRIIDTLSKDQLTLCLRNVRNSVRVVDIECRKVDVFKEVNAAVIEGLSNVYGKSLKLYITPERVSIFGELCSRVAEFRSRVACELLKVLKESSKVDSSISGCENDNIYCGNSLQLRPDASINVDRDKLRLLREKIFPERRIEKFDEITEEMIDVQWDYDVEAMLSSLKSSLDSTLHIEHAERMLEAQLFMAEKAKKIEDKRLARLAADGSDDEREEDGEEEEEEEGNIKPTATRHRLTVEAENLISECKGRVTLLTIRPLPKVTSSSVSMRELFDGFDEWDYKSRIDAGFTGDMLVAAVSPFPSPFTTDEGLAAWTTALDFTAESTPVVVPKGKGKEAPQTIPGTSQINAYYKSMYNLVYNGLLEVADKMFSSVDKKLEAEARSVLDMCPVNGINLLQSAVCRKNDIMGENGTGKIAYINISGNAFISDGVASCFDEIGVARAAAMKSVTKAAMDGATAVVLIYDSNFIASSHESILLKADILRSVLISSAASARPSATKLKQLRRKAIKAGQEYTPYEHYDYNVITAASFPELYEVLKSIHLRSEDTSDIHETIIRLTVVLVEDICNPSAVPAEPPLPDVFESDDEPAISIGIEEYISYKKKRWESIRPHRVSVSLQHSGAIIQCYADVPAALQEAVQTDKLNGTHSVWIESSISSIFYPSNAFVQRLLLNVDRFVSDDLRNAIVWTGIMQLMPRATTYLSTGDDVALDQNHSNVSDESADTIDINPATPPESVHKAIGAHFKKLFPSIKSPRFTAMVGGEIKLDKFNVIDNLLDVASTIIITGEVAVPFLALCNSNTHTFDRYVTMCKDNAIVCQHLLQKALQRGVRVVLPIDAVMFEEAIVVDKHRCVDMGARDEGVEIESDRFIISLQSNSALVNVYGYIYDIGPQSCAVISQILVETDIFFAWGTVGVCEVSGLQTGQRAIVDATIAPLSAAIETSVAPASDFTVATAEVRKGVPAHSIIIGNSTVEWYARFVDSDGEMNGQLARYGRVSYLSRESKMIVGLLCRHTTQSLEHVLHRESREDEWDYIQRSPLNVSEEDVEEEEDDEDDE